MVPALAPDSGSGKVFRQSADRRELEIAPENVDHDARLTLIDHELAVSHIVSEWHRAFLLGSGNLVAARRSAHAQTGRTRAGCSTLDSILKNVKQDGSNYKQDDSNYEVEDSNYEVEDSNYEVAASNCGEQIDDILDGVVGAVIGGFESAVWAMLRVWSVVEAAVGKGSA